MDKKIVIGLCMFLIIISSNVYSAEEDRESTYGLFSVSLLEQSPSAIPAVALEQKSNARVKLFLSVSSATIGTIDYRIKDVYVKLAESNPLIIGIERDRVAPDKEDLDYNDYFTLTDNFLSVTNVVLNRAGTGKRVLIKEDTAEQICRGELEPGKGLGENIPDEINVSLRVDVTFVACKGKIITDNKGGLDCLGTGFLGPQDFKFDQEAYSRAERERAECVDRINNLAANSKWSDASRQAKIIENCGEQFTKNPRYIKDTIYFDTTIGVDKRNLDKLVGPEELREQICRTEEYKQTVSKWINKTEKAENFFEGTCLAGILGGAANIIFRGDVCDTMDSISLGCDWLFCPSEGCKGGIDPTGSLVASTSMCWDVDKPFFGKSLGFILSEKKAVNLLGEEDTTDLVKYNNKDKNYYTYNEDLINKREDYKSSFCDYNTGDKPAIKAPHYACVSGVKGNLQIINLMIDSYQECLIRARQGGVSVGVCDRLRNLYLCDRVLGEAIPLLEAGPQGFLSDAFSKILSKPVDLVTGDSEEYFKSRRDATKVAIEQSVAKYQNVPFLQLIGNDKEFLKEQLCSAFVEGTLFNLEDFKEKFNILSINYPDSALVYTEKRIWDYYKLDEDKIITEKQEVIEEGNKYQEFYEDFKKSGDNAGRRISQGQGILFEDSELGSIKLTSEYFEIGDHSVKNSKKYIENNELITSKAGVTYNIGVDYTVSDSKVRSWFNGVVTSAGFRSGYGNCVGMELSDLYKYDYSNEEENIGDRDYTIYSIYCHLEKINVKVGDTIGAGDTVGVMGDTGSSSGEHVDLRTLFYARTNEDKDLFEVYIDPREIRYLSGFYKDVAYQNIKIEKDGSKLVPAEYSYDVVYQIFNGESTDIGFNVGQVGSYRIYLTDLKPTTKNEKCNAVINIAQGVVKPGDLVQNNIFIVNNCDAETQCLVFKGRTYCRPVGKILGLDTRQQDPLGLTLFSEDDEDGDGISDGWETKYFGLKKIEEEGTCDNCRRGDPDNDGYCTAQEYLSGTDPNDRLRHPTSAPDCDYAIERLDTLAKEGKTQPINTEETTSEETQEEQPRETEQEEIAQQLTEEEILLRLMHSSQNKPLKVGNVDKNCDCGSKCEGYADWLVEYSKGDPEVNPYLILAQAIIESGCKQDSNETNSKGLMQISSLAFEDACKETGLTYKDIIGLNDDEENLRCGIKYLKKMYNRYAKDENSVSIYKGGVNAFCFNEEYKNKFLSYTKWNIALRGYNGLGCSGGDVDYVEKVNQAYSQLLTGASDLREFGF